MAKPSKKQLRQKKTARTARSALKWGIGVALAGLIVYGIMQTSGFAFDERALGVVDFSILDSSQKRTALTAANGARCTCGCGMTLAQCVATDMSCPVRDRNIDRIKTIVQEARAR
jgi:hypothetical protein